MGVRIKGIIDRTGGLIEENGLGYEEIKKLFLEKRENALHQEELIPFEKVNKMIWSSGAEIFIPAAGSRLLSLDQIKELIESGLACISCGANVPFMDEEIFLGPPGKFADQSISLIPDFIANCGMARVFAYLMNPEAEITDHAIFDDVQKTIYRALKNVYDEQKNPVEIASKAFEISLRELL